MDTTFITDFLSIVLLAGAFFLLWKERLNFFSWRPFLPAIIFLAAGHICDILGEHASVLLSDALGISHSVFETATAIGGNVADNMGIAFLIYGFVKIIKYEREKEKQIQELEQLLPLCSSCKKYRTIDGEWLPIEKYLIDNGAPTLTHGICPECSHKLYGDLLGTKR
jgi:hypothetical protein